MGRAIEINAFLFKGKFILFVLIFCDRKKEKWFHCLSKKARSAWFRSQERNMMWLKFLEWLRGKKIKLHTLISLHQINRIRRNMEQRLETKWNQKWWENRMSKWIKSEIHYLWLNNLVKLKFIQAIILSFFISLKISFVLLTKSMCSPFANTFSRSRFNWFLYIENTLSIPLKSGE